MHTKTMEGLVGANANMNLLNTPMRIFKEASRRGDLATMERAGKYAGEFAGRAADYKTEANKGMEEDAKEAREKAESEREKAIQKRKEEREKLDQRIADSNGAQKETANSGQSVAGETGSVKPNRGYDGEVRKAGDTATDVNKKASAIYTRDGRVNQTETSISMFV